MSHIESRECTTTNSLDGNFEGLSVIQIEPRDAVTHKLDKISQGLLAIQMGPRRTDKLVEIL